VYDTWAGLVVAVVDAPGDTCTEEGHRVDGVIWRRSRAGDEIEDGAHAVRSRSA
jgi:hypothetical protein